VFVPIKQYYNTLYTTITHRLDVTSAALRVRNVIRCFVRHTFGSRVTRVLGNEVIRGHTSDSGHQAIGLYISGGGGLKLQFINDHCYNLQPCNIRVGLRWRRPMWDVRWCVYVCVCLCHRSDQITFLGSVECTKTIHHFRRLHRAYTRCLHGRTLQGILSYNMVTHVTHYLGLTLYTHFDTIIRMRMTLAREITANIHYKRDASSYYSINVLI